MCVINCWRRTRGTIRIDFQNVSFNSLIKAKVPLAGPETATTSTECTPGDLTVTPTDKIPESRKYHRDVQAKSPLRPVKTHKGLKFPGHFEDSKEHRTAQERGY